MERVWLSTTYYDDPKICGLSADAERMFTRGMAYSGKAETRGFIPAVKLAELGNKRGDRPLRELLEAGLWLPATGGYQIAAWSHWQDSGDKLLDRKIKDRERQARHRSQARFSADSEPNQPRISAEPAANQTGFSAEKNRHSPSELGGWENVSRDSHVTVTPPDKTREEKSYLTTVVSSPFVPPASLDEPPREPIPTYPAPTLDAWRMVRDEIPNDHPQATKTMLATKVSEMAKSGTDPELIRAALRLWLTKPTLGPGALPLLVSEVIKTATAPATLPPAMAKSAGWLATSGDAARLADLNAQITYEPHPSRLELA